MELQGTRGAALWIASDIGGEDVGVKTSSVVAQLADEHDIDMPISREMYRVTHGLQPARTAFRGLLRTLSPGSVAGAQRGSYAAQTELPDVGG
jgi:hypothetical protein